MWQGQCTKLFIGGEWAAPATAEALSVVSLRTEQVVAEVPAASRAAAARRAWTAAGFVEPTIFADVKPSMRIAQEEIFGPVLAVLAYVDDDEAVSMANDSDYDLNGSVFTSDPSTVWQWRAGCARARWTSTAARQGPPRRWAASSAAGLAGKRGLRGSTHTSR